MRVVWIGFGIVAAVGLALLLTRGPTPGTSRDRDASSPSASAPIIPPAPVLAGTRNATSGEPVAGTSGLSYGGPDPFGPTPGAVRGVVYGSDKQPAAGMTVHMTGLRTPRQVRSDARGRFHFPDVPASWSPQVWVAENGLVPGGTKFGASAHIQPGKTHDLTIHLVKALTVHGRVVRWDGAAVVGARVWIAAGARHAIPKAYKERLVTISGEDGAYQIEGLPRHVEPYCLQLHAVAEGLPEGSAELEKVILFGNEERRKPGDPLEIVLGKPCFADVVVVDVETGVGVPEAIVGKGPYGVNPLGSTDAQGRVRVGPIPQGRHAWMVWAAGWDAPHGAQAVHVETRPGTVPQVTHTMWRTYRLEGRVVYGDGTPADDRRFGLIVMKDGAFRMATDVSGTFGVDGLRRGTYEILISAKDMHSQLEEASESHILGRVSVQAGAKDVVVTLGGARPPTLELHVRDGDGTPLAVGAVVPRTDDETWNIDCWEPMRFKDGVARIGGLKTPVWVEVIPAPGTPWARKRIGPIAPGTPRVQVGLERGYTVTGLVLDPDGTPIEGAEIRAYPDVPEAEYERYGSHHTHGTAHTAADGRFAFDRLWQGRYWLHTMPTKPYAPQDPVACTAGARDVEIRLTRRLDLALPILDAAGRRLPGARVAVWTPPWFGDGSCVHATTDADGIAHLRGVDPNAGQCIDVTPPRGVGESRRLWLEAWTPADDAIRLPGAWALAGRVIDGEGMPTAGVRVRLETSTPGPASITRTDAQGRFRFVQLPFEPVRLTALGPKGRTTPDVTRVASGSAAVELRLAAYAGRLRVRIANWPSSASQPPAGPIARFAVWCPDAPWLVRTGQPTHDGFVQVDGLDPARTWNLAVVRDDIDLHLRLDALHADGRERTVNATPSRPLRGRVRSSEQTWPRKLVVVEIGRTCNIADDGTYEMSGLPPGRWTLRASAYRGRNLVYRTVVATGETAPDIDFGR